MRNACSVKALDELVGELTGEMGGFGRASGVAAFDALMGPMMGRTSALSMATLCQMAQDNGSLLFPHRIPVELLLAIAPPYIVLHKHHYTAIKRIEDLPDSLGTHVHVVAHYALPDFVMDIVEAREMLGARSIFSKIGREFKRAAKNPYVQMGAGLIPGAGPFLAAGLGAYGGSLKGGGLGGALKGGLTGYAAGGTGAAVGGGIRGAFTGYQGAAALKSGSPGFMGGAKGIATGAFKGAGAAGAEYGRATVRPFGANVAPAVAGGPIGAGGAAGYQAGQYSAMDATQRAAYGASPTGAQFGYARAAGQVGGGAGGGGGTESFFARHAGKLGMAASTISALIPTPEYRGPDVDPETLRAMAARGPLTEAGKAAAAEVVRTLNADGTFANQLAGMAEPFSMRGQEMLARNLASEQKQVTERYTEAGMLDSGEYRDAMRRLDDAHRSEVSLLYAQVTSGLGQSFLNYKQAMVGAGIDIDTQSLREILGLTGMQVEEAGLKYGADVETVLATREAFASMGMLGLAKSLGLTGGFQMAMG